MKLKTAFQDEYFKLGEVADVSMATMPDGRIVARATAKVGGEHTFYYDSLEAVYNDWKDYEEPKEYWVVDYIECGVDKLKYCPEDHAQDDFNKQIGNYFETKEEAEKAVEKLKAVKRLKDKGFRFDGWDENHHNLGIIEFSFDKVENNVWSFEEDLNLLFCTEVKNE